MAATLDIDGFTWRFDTEDPIDISIPLQFNGLQPNAYGVATATSTPCEAGDLVGDTRKGGSCNFEQYTFIPHCNGTHTECVGHITHDRISIVDCLNDVFVPAVLATIEPVETTNETYTSKFQTGDRLITRAALENELAGMSAQALVIRTTPNSDEKLTGSYSDTNVPPYFTTEAMEFIVGLGFRHLLVDVPSIDRLYDEGRLSNHRIFWKIEPASFELTEIARRSCTITELVYVPNDIRDGRYILNLQIAPFASDASPSRPVLFRVQAN